MCPMCGAPGGLESSAPHSRSGAQAGGGPAVVMSKVPLGDGLEPAEKRRERERRNDIRPEGTHITVGTQCPRVDARDSGNVVLARAGGLPSHIHITDEGRGCSLGFPSPEEKESGPGERSLTEGTSQVPAVSFQPVPSYTSLPPPALGHRALLIASWTEMKGSRVPSVQAGQSPTLRTR